jgi:hypothetical protein
MLRFLLSRHNAPPRGRACAHGAGPSRAGMDACAGALAVARRRAVPQRLEGPAPPACAPTRERSGGVRAGPPPHRVPALRRGASETVARRLRRLSAQRATHCVPVLVALAHLSHCL